MLKSYGLGLTFVLLGLAACGGQGEGTANTNVATASASATPAPQAATPTAAATPGAASPTPTDTPGPPAATTATVIGSNFKWRDEASGTPVTTIKVGGTVTWKIANPSARHSLEKDEANAEKGCEELDDSFDSDPLSAGQSVTRTFTRAGTFGYHCGLHGGEPDCKTPPGTGMAGVIKVVP